jgi:hypothetical protein
MSDQQTVTPSTPEPSMQDAILEGLKALLTLLGAAGISAPSWANSATLPVIAGAAALLAREIMAIWQMYAKAKANHANSVASAQTGVAVKVA